MKGFKEFLLRGNIVDLAVAVVIGTAFVNLVSAFTGSFINPVLAAAGTHGEPVRELTRSGQPWCGGTSRR